ncbi:tripartite tricarboxylate transporter substrate binding protein [Belnapia sp. T6]|uniref:Tripartite tricarboxylate transporter substrate binding protein n=1 Tax=Belnapia mucosa TaxID=2804532 RepID=A0ABS1V7Y0_9PROT|nr:tripartite tricarboxylate transporter substrate binding protein [Belnapia mucosa]MBL6457781.1 tripartite tricarboxylate transporter substrate binding protein [Belnapia mucosa]
MRNALAALLLAALPLMPAAAWQPDRPLRVVAGFAAGGTGDLTARIIAEMAGAALGQNAVVENRTGANGVIAAEAVARSGTDGLTVLQCPMGTMTITPNLPGQRLPLDVTTELVPVANLALSTYGLVAARDRFADVAAMLAEARAKPGALSFASAGTGSAQHLAGELLKRLAKIDLVHIPYRGAAPAIVDMLGGRVDILITNLGDVAGQIREGSLRLLAVGDETGHPNFSAPPLSASVPGFTIAGWFAACAPRTMPREAVEAWAGAIRAGLERPDWRKRLLDNGLTPMFEGPETLAARMERDRAQFRDLIQGAGIRAE